MRIGARGFFIAIAVAAAAALTLAQPATLVYDPLENTEPPVQGWYPNYQHGTFGVIGGEYELNTMSSPTNYHYFGIPTSMINRRWSDGVSVEASLRVVRSESTFNGQGEPRYGFSVISFVDPDLRLFNLSVLEDRVVLQWHADGNRVEHLMDTTDATHTYNLRTDESGGHLYVDGAFIFTVPYAYGGFAASEVWWADGTSGAGCHVFLRRYEIEFEPAEAPGQPDCLVDLNNDGFLDNGDIFLFVTLFLAGCS